MVCALRPEKGLGMLMEAFRKVKAAGRGVKLLIVGSGPMLRGVAGGQRCRLPLPAGGTKRRAVAAGNGHFRAALAFRSAVQFADGSYGLRLLPAWRRILEGIRNWSPMARRDCLFPVGDAQAWRTVWRLLLDQPDYRRRLAAQAGAPHAYAFHTVSNPPTRWPIFTRSIWWDRQGGEVFKC